MPDAGKGCAGGRLRSKQVIILPQKSTKDTKRIYKMNKINSCLVIVMLLLPMAVCLGQQENSLFTTPFVEPLEKDSVSVPQAKARMEELKAKIAYYFPEDYLFNSVSYENERTIDRLKLSKTICRGAKRGGITGLCLTGLLIIKYWDGMGWAGAKALLIIPIGAITGALAGSAASALFYTEKVGEKEIANINDLIKRYNAIAAKRVN